MADILIHILSTIALLFIIFAMGAIVLLARRMALLMDDLRSLVNMLKEKIPPTTEKITEVAEESRTILGNLRAMLNLTQNLPTLLLSGKKLAYYAGVFLAGLRIGLKLFLKARKKSKKEVDECGGEQR